MSGFFGHFTFDRESRTLWSICVISAFCIVLISLYHFTTIMHHLYCIPKPAFEPGHVRKYSALSVTFAVLCVVATFSTYPICTEMLCGSNIVGFLTFVFVLDSYVLAKVFVYLLFIDCLFNPYYRCIYQYPMWIENALYALLVLMIISVAVGNVHNGLQCAGEELPEYIGKAWCAVYVMTDCIISIATMLLFFRPMCCNRKKDPISANVDMSVVKKYRIISTLQLIAAITYEISFLLRIYGGALHAFGGLWSSYLDVCSVVQMLDCLLLMICIYRGFARKETVCDVFTGLTQSSLHIQLLHLCMVLLQTKNCCEIYLLYFIWCCCGCCSPPEKGRNSGVSMQCKDDSAEPQIEPSSMNDFSMTNTVQISRIPDDEFVEV